MFLGIPSFQVQRRRSLGLSAVVAIRLCLIFIHFVHTIASPATVSNNDIPPSHPSETGSLNTNSKTQHPVQPTPEHDSLATTSSTTTPTNNLTIPDNVLIVRQRPESPSEFATIQAALDELENRKGPQEIKIHDGIYFEQLLITYKPPLTIRAFTSGTVDYTNNRVIISIALGAKYAGSNSASATLNVEKNDFSMYHITVANTFGTGTDTQALALNAKGFRHGYYGCLFESYQDTVRAYRGVQFFARCYITGAVDFIFSRDVQAWFEEVSIAVKGNSKETITASGRRMYDPYGYLLFNRANIFSSPDFPARPRSAYLGRPWRNKASVGFQLSYMSDVVNNAGWEAWNPPNDPRTDHVLFQEFGNTGPGTEGPRNFTTPLLKPYTPEQVLGKDYLTWIDNTYIPDLTPITPPASVIPDPQTKPVVPDPKAKPTVPDPKTTVPDPKTTVPDPKTTVPDPKTTVPDPKTTVPDPKTTVPNPSPNP